MFNKQSLIGHIGTNPESKVLDTGTAVTSFTLATNKRWKDKQGQQQERTTWFNIRSYGKLAELANDYFRKGKLLHIEGETVNKVYEDREGNKRFTSYVVMDTFNFLSKNSDTATPSNTDTLSTTEVTTGKQDDDDDLPF